MDQSAFRSFLGGQASSSSTSSAGRASTSASASRGAFGGSKQRLGIGAGGQRRDQGIPEAPKSSAAEFRPRQQKLAAGKGKGKASDDNNEEKPSEPSHRRYGYTDRASMRRAGLDEAEEEEVREERRPRGLDFSKLDPDKRALLGIEPEELPEETIPDEPLPLKTDEEIERELAEAEASLVTEDNSTAELDQQRKTEQQDHLEPPPKKQKRSRAEMLRDLQAKIAASSAGATEVKVLEPTGNQGRKKEHTTAASEPAVLKGFRKIERAPEKKTKKKVVKNAELHAEEQPEVLAPDSRVATMPEKDGALEAAVEDDDDDDIFGGAGDYDDGLSADEASAEEGEQKEKAPEGTNGGPIKYFEDQDEIIPKFETWRSPTPPPRQRTGSPPGQNPYAKDDKEPEKPQRLEGFSTSQYTARDLLERDNALAKEEKRKLKKLKGKDKKEAMERLSELDGSRTAEQKEKDRLNRDAQEYENYERKKQKRARPEAS